jgi:hypothetical protein
MTETEPSKGLFVAVCRVGLCKILEASSCDSPRFETDATKTTPGLPNTGTVICSHSMLELVSDGAVVSISQLTRCTLFA